MSCLCDIAGAVTLDVLHPQYGCMRVGYTQLQDVARGIEAMALGGRWGVWMVSCHEGAVACVG